MILEYRFSTIQRVRSIRLSSHPFRRGSTWGSLMMHLQQLGRFLSSLWTVTSLQAEMARRLSYVRFLFYPPPFWSRPGLLVRGPNCPNGLVSRSHGTLSSRNRRTPRRAAQERHDVVQSRIDLVFAHHLSDLQSCFEPGFRRSIDRTCFRFSCLTWLISGLNFELDLSLRVMFDLASNIS